jgi:hypothetical protein
MTNQQPKQCITKDCYNPVLDGKYCEQCRQKRKEIRNKIVAGTGGIAAALLVVVKGGIKHAPKIAAKAIQVALKR